MQRMMDTVPSSLYSTAPDGKYTFVNKKASDYLGMTLDQIQGWGWVEPLTLKSGRYVVKEFKKALATGSSYSKGTSDQTSRRNLSLASESRRASARRRRADRKVVWGRHRYRRAKASGGPFTGNPCQIGASIARGHRR
jgi:hypothetical protein